MSWRCCPIAAAAIAAALALGSAYARADVGQLRASRSAGPWQLSVFTSPAPACAGEVEFSILVQERDTDAPAPEVVTSIQARHEETGRVVRATATRAAGTNKLFQTALCDLAMAGTWHITVSAGPDTALQSVEFDMSLSMPARWGHELALWIGWPVLPVMLFVAHQFLTRRVASAGVRPAFERA